MNPTQPMLTCSYSTPTYGHHLHYNNHHLSPLSLYQVPPFPSKTRYIKLVVCSAQTQQNSNPTTFRVVFAAGGTGGRIIPAVAIADELKTQKPNTQFLFIGTPNSMESTAIASAGYDFTSIPAYSLKRPLLSLQNILIYPYQLLKSVVFSYRVLNRFDPHVVVGTGGYVAFPTCFAAFLKRVKLVIQEQNAYPGLANWVLSYFADVVFVAFNSTVDSFPRKNKCLVCGNPVRLRSGKEFSKVDVLSHFFKKVVDGIDVSKAKVVLVLGGSLGANTINIALLNLYYQMLSENKNLFIIWQTGVESFIEMESLVRDHPRLLLRPFLRSMDFAYAVADLLISRAGAMTCSEILAAGKPAILIPSPNVAEGHQFKNASLMADLAGSRIITEDELDSITLKAAIEEILGDENQMAIMSERAFKAAKPEASAEIVRHILALVNPSTQPIDSTI